MASKKSRIELSRGADRQWYWRAVARNGRVTADGAEGYTTKQAALKAIKSVQEMIRRGDIETVEWKN